MQEVPAKKEGHKRSLGPARLKVKNLQRGTANARHWEEKDRHVHQLRAQCPFPDQLENIYCAMQLCARCGALFLETVWPQ